MKNTKTRRQFARHLYEQFTRLLPGEEGTLCYDEDQWLRLVKVHEALGVEFAPEPELPEWFGKEELKFEQKPAYADVTIHGVSVGGFNDSASARAWVEGNNRFVRMKRRLKEVLPHMDLDCSAYQATTDALKIARGEEVS